MPYRRNKRVGDRGMRSLWADLVRYLGGDDGRLLGDFDYLSLREFLLSLGDGGVSGIHTTLMFALTPVVLLDGGDKRTLPAAPIGNASPY